MEEKGSEQVKEERLVPHVDVGDLDLLLEVLAVGVAQVHDVDVDVGVVAYVLPRDGLESSVLPSTLISNE